MRISFLLIAGLLPLAVWSADWSATLKGGGQVIVDPSTNRAMVLRNGVETPLWDGVHQLEDGSVLRIRSGVVVPNEQILQARKLPEEPAQAWEGVTIVGYSPCQKLVRQVCGAQNQCQGSTSCDAAGQLLDMEDKERAAGSSPNLMTYSSGQCQQALERDRQFFAPCGTHASASVAQPVPPVGPPATSCEHLIVKVCGAHNECAQTQPCQVARQMLDLHRKDPADQSAWSDGSNQCQEALLDEEYFAPCRP